MSGGAIILLPQAYGTIVKPDTNPFAAGSQLEAAL